MVAESLATKTVAALESVVDLPMEESLHALVDFNLNVLLLFISFIQVALMTFASSPLKCMILSMRVLARHGQEGFCV